MAATSQERKQVPGNTVFVGNIPYQATEKQLTELCEEIGPVRSFKIMRDKDNDKPKGFGFCEYLDDETALSAVRNLNGAWIQGRQLRVNLSSKAAKAAPPPLNYQQKDGNVQSLVIHLLCNYTKQQLCSALTDMQALPGRDKERADYLFALCPQLPNALLQAVLIVNSSSSGQPLLPQDQYPCESTTHIMMEGDKSCSGSGNGREEQEHPSIASAASQTGTASDHFDPTQHSSKRAKLEHGWIDKGNMEGNESSSTITSESDEAIHGIEVSGSEMQSVQHVLPFSADMLSYLVDIVSRGEVAIN